MKGIFSTFQSKLHHWCTFTKSCFSTYNPLLKDARELSKIVQKSMILLNESDRIAILERYFDPSIAHIIGMYLTIYSWHEGIQILGVSNQKLNALTFIRPQLEALLIFLFFTEPNDDMVEVEERVENYLDWVIVKMYQNMTRSSKFHLVKIVPGMKEYEETVRTNYEYVKKKYEYSGKKLKALENSYSFIPNKRKLAKSQGIEDLYSHVYAETSATIHIADISDRMYYHRDSTKVGYIYNSIPENAVWQMALSNKIEVVGIRRFGKFFGIEQQITKLLSKVFRKMQQGKI